MCANAIRIPVINSQGGGLRTTWLFGKHSLAMTIVADRQVTMALDAATMSTRSRGSFTAHFLQVSR